MSARSSRRALVAAVAVLAFVPVPAGAESHVSAARTTADVAYGVGGNHPTRPTVVARAVLARFVAVGAGAGTTHGAARYGGEQLIVCLAYKAGGRDEIGCAFLPPGRAATDGAYVPEGATIRARVPVSGRRGGWIEADLRLDAGDSPLRTPPLHTSLYVETGDVLGSDVPVGVSAAAGPALYRECGIRGTLRTDRGLKATIGSLAPARDPSYVARYELAGARAGLDPGVLTSRLAATLSDAR